MREAQFFYCWGKTETQRQACHRGLRQAPSERRGAGTAQAPARLPRWLRGWSYQPGMPGGELSLAAARVKLSTGLSHWRSSAAPLGHGED